MKGIYFKEELVLVVHVLRIETSKHLTSVVMSIISSSSSFMSAIPEP